MVMRPFFFLFCQKVFCLNPYNLHLTRKCNSSSINLHREQRHFEISVLGLAYLPCLISSVCELAQSGVIAVLYLCWNITSRNFSNPKSFLNNEYIRDMGFCCISDPSVAQFCCQWFYYFFLQYFLKSYIWLHIYVIFSRQFTCLHNPHSYSTAMELIQFIKYLFDNFWLYKIF